MLTTATNKNVLTPCRPPTTLNHDLNVTMVKSFLGDLDISTCVYLDAISPFFTGLWYISTVSALLNGWRQEFVAPNFDPSKSSSKCQPQLSQDLRDGSYAVPPLCCVHTELPSYHLIRSVYSHFLSVFGPALCVIFAFFAYLHYLDGAARIKLSCSIYDHQANSSLFWCSEAFIYQVGI